MSTGGVQFRPAAAADQSTGALVRVRRTDLARIVRIRAAQGSVSVRCEAVEQAVAASATQRLLAAAAA